MKLKSRDILLLGMILGLVGGGYAGWKLGQRADDYFGFLGAFFLTALKMLVLPLIICSLISGVGQLGDIRRLGRTAGTTLLYYFSTTAMAVLIGIIVVNLIKPGVREDAAPATEQIAQRIESLEKKLAALEGLTDPKSIVRAEELRRRIETQRGFLAKATRYSTEKRSLFQVLQDIVMLFVTPDLIRGPAGEVQAGKVQRASDTLAIIVFSIIFGGLLTTIGPKGQLVLDVFDGMNEAILKFVHLVIWFAPVGIFGLVAAQLGKTGGGDAFLEEIVRLGRYAVTVILGLLAHGVLVLPLLLVLLARRNPFRYVAALSHALINAFSTASSGATLPLTLEGVEERAGVRSQAARFVLPMGATVNMDGTALYEAVAVIFIAQANGIDLSAGSQAIIFLTASLAAIGAAAIPEAGLVTMVLVLRAVDLPAEWIGLILSIDWFLDRCRTTVNVWGDAVGAAVIERHGFSKAAIESFDKAEAETSPG